MSTVVFETKFAIGIFDHLSIATYMYATLLGPLGKGQAKSNGNFSFGSTTEPIWNECCFPVAAFRFLLCSVHCRQLCAICSKERCMCGNQTCWPRSNIAADPECVRWMLSNTVWRSWVEIAIRSSISRQSSGKCTVLDVVSVLSVCIFNCLPIAFLDTIVE